MSERTSKIVALTDLEAITTLGFRGEALPSIAAMADVEVLTQADNDPAGSYLRLANSTIVSNEKHSGPRGTTITVHHHTAEHADGPTGHLRRPGS